MKEGALLDRPPITTVERFRPDEIERTGDGPAIAAREEYQCGIAHRLAKLVEPCARQIGPAPLARPGRLVAMPRRLPMGRLDLGPSQRDDLQPLDRGGPFLPDRLALAAR